MSLRPQKTAEQTPFFVKMRTSSASTLHIRDNSRSPFVLDPVMRTILDKKHDLGGNVRLEIRQPTAACFSLARIDAPCLQIGQGCTKELLLEGRQRSGSLDARGLASRSSFQFGSRWSSDGRKIHAKRLNEQFCCYFRFAVNFLPPFFEYEGVAHFLDIDAPRRDRIGLFWFVATDRNPSRLARCDVAILSPQSDAAASRPGDLHALAWPLVQRTVRSFADRAFDYFPRGCVEYGEQRRTWIISLDRKLNRGAFIAEIVLAWQLSPPDIAVRVDPNVISVACVGPPAIERPTAKRGRS